MRLASRIKVLLSRPQPELGTGTLTLELYAAVAGVPTGVPLATKTISGFEVPVSSLDGSFVTFTGLNAMLSEGQGLAIALSGTSTYLWWGTFGQYPLGMIARQFYDAGGNITRPWAVHPEETGDGGFRAFVDLGATEPVPTPEPGTLILLGSGALLMTRRLCRSS